MTLTEPLAGPPQAPPPDADQVADWVAPAAIGPWIELPLADPSAGSPLIGELRLLDSEPKAVRLQRILSAWRAAERTMLAMPPGSPAWTAANTAFVELRAVFLRVVDEPGPG